MKRILLFFLWMLAVSISTHPLQAQWVRTLPDSITVRCFAVSGTNLFAGTDFGVFLSTNNGASWSSVSNGLTNSSVNALTVFGTNLFAVNYNAAFLSTNNGTSWTEDDAGFFENYYLNTLAVSGSNIFAGTDYGVFLSTNNGKSWTTVNTGFKEIVLTLAVSGTNLIAGTYGDGVFLSTNNGSSWTGTGVGGNVVLSLAVNGINLIAGTRMSNTEGNPGIGGIFLSTNNGTSWAAADSGLPRYEGGAGICVNALAVSGTNLFAGTDGDGVFLSTNNGTSWTAVDSGLHTNTIFYALAVSGTSLFAGTLEGAWRRPLSEMITAVKATESETPSVFSLSQNYPNPFNPTTTISFAFPSRSFVSLKVFDMLGREVSTIVSEELPAGSYNRQWNAATMASSVYFYRLQAGTFTETKKLLLLK